MKGFLFGSLIGGAGGILLGLLIGVALLTGAGYVMTGGVNVPYDSNHSYIAERISVVDSTDGVTLSCKHVMSGPAEFHPYALNAFTAKKTYTQSLWIFCAGNDIDVTLTIWGAGDDGHTYSVEFGRHAGNAITIHCFNDTYIWEANSDTGYLGTTIIL